MTAEGYMYCPRCGAEYRSGFVACADCNVALVTYEPPVRSSTDEHDEHADLLTGPIVELTRRSSRFEADIIIAKLRSAGIPVTLDAADAGGWYPHLGFVQGYRVLVTEDGLAEARHVLTGTHRVAPQRRRRRPRS